MRASLQQVRKGKNAKELLTNKISKLPCIDPDSKMLIGEKFLHIPLTSEEFYKLIALDVNQLIKLLTTI